MQAKKYPHSPLTHSPFINNHHGIFVVATVNTPDFIPQTEYSTLTAAANNLSKQGPQVMIRQLFHFLTWFYAFVFFN